MKSALAAVRRLAVAAAAATFLAGCVTTAPDGKPIDNTPGLVIVGFAYTGSQRTPLGSCPVGRWGPFAGHYNLDFFKLDENNQTAWYRRQMAYDGVCESADAPTPARYNFLELSPGRYQLDGVTNSSLQPLIILRNAPKFTVGPGEVIYIGDVTFDGQFGRTGITNARLVMVNTAESARAALAARNGPVDRMVVRQLEIINRPNYQ